MQQEPISFVILISVNQETVIQYLTSFRKCISLECHVQNEVFLSYF